MGIQAVLWALALAALSACGGDDGGGGGSGGGAGGSGVGGSGGAAEGSGGGGSGAGGCVPVTESIDPPAGATLEFMAECTLGADDECETDLCYAFNRRGAHCTAACTQDCECPAPSPGCNNMGICKAP